MAKKKTSRAAQSAAASGAGKARNPKGDEGAESIAGYFRRVFQAKPGLLRKRSNVKLLKQWLADHPGETEVPQSVKNSLANLKSVLRSKKRKRVARRAQESQPVGPEPRAKVATVPTGSSDLEALEHQIDECLTLARVQDREGLHDVIAMLRRARNTVVWKMGQ